MMQVAPRWGSLLVCLVGWLELCKSCSPQQLFFVSPPTWIKFKNCLMEEAESMDLGYVGANRALEAKCWCSTNVRQVVNDYNCNDHPNFKHLSPINCEDTCDSDKAKKCMETCPPICLEANYAPESCDCEQDNCLEHTQCITDKGKSETMSGELERVCHERELDESSELDLYFRCMHASAIRTPWHRRNSQSYCECQSNLTRALDSAKCCGSKWANPVCEQDCLTDADCETQEAQSCLERCADICKQIDEEKMGEACRTTCMTETSECAKWRTCKPITKKEFDYVCSDGSKPQSNGCCKLYVHNGLMYQLGCPKLCDQRSTYRITRSNTYRLECLCEDCPETIEKAVFKWNATVKDSFWTNGQMVLSDIAREEGIELGATREMQVLMQKRNEAIRKAIEDHNDLYDARIEGVIEDIANTYHEEIIVVARKHIFCELNPGSSNCTSPVTSAPALTSPVTSAPTLSPLASDSGDSSDDSGSEDNTTIIMIVVGVVVVVLGMGAVGVGFVLRKNKAKQGSSTANTGAAAAPIEGDSNVVLGRPVQGAVSENSVASAGAPVQMCAPEKEKGQSSTSDNDVPGEA